ncbi:BTB/POZ domain and ankyrin repeat-containing protein NPR1-like [Apium graveolens]|uniref:BTB/POZ domain and ankyrin repeat-containing protein NPR1-like n=1 Tax=Apium graveolens TaxID=4045 RepID=UPI003D7A0F1F
MEDLLEQSYMSFTSSLASNGSTCYNLPTHSVPEGGSSPEIISLAKLSASLEQLMVSSLGIDYSDADIAVDDVSVGVHRCILATRSNFFHEKFKEDMNSLDKKESRPKYYMSKLLPYGSVGYESFLVFLSYLYTGNLKPCPPEVSTCVDGGCDHHTCRPAINFSVELMYASAIFQVPELVSLYQRRLFNFVEKALVEDVLPIILVAFHCQLIQLLNQCIHRVANSDLDSISIEKEVPSEVAKDIMSIRLTSQCHIWEENNSAMVTDDLLCEKRIRKIHKALDSDDVELVKRLLPESDITLDAAHALHYAVAYCDPKVVSEVLNLGLANVNLRNAQGYTVLHVAALRREPSIIVKLLEEGASALEATPDGQNSVIICRKLTRPKDYHAITEQGHKSNKYRLCIDVLEREMCRIPMATNASSSSPVMDDDRHMKLLYIDLKNRVALAHLLFPSEAKLAMEIANAEATFQYAGLLQSKVSNGDLKDVDADKIPTVKNERILAKIAALKKTVETGRRYFSNCSEVLDKFMLDDLHDESFFLNKGSAEEQEIKKQRYMELKEDLQKAFSKDKAELSRAGLSSTTSSSKVKRQRKS